MQARGASTEAERQEGVGKTEASQATAQPGRRGRLGDKSGEADRTVRAIGGACVPAQEP